MKSYNCFYSALYEVLEQYFFEKTHLLINNRWQFFYKKSDVYTDDTRIIGEWPMLYHEWHLNKLYEKIGINIIFTNCLDSSINFFWERVKMVPVIIFVNKMNILTNSSSQLTHKCVSTVIVRKIKDRIICCQTFDNELNAFEQIDIEVLYHAWVAASDYEQLNQCNISIEYIEENNKFEVEEFAKVCMKSSLIDYFTLNNTENIFLGAEGMKMFSEDIFRWDKDIFKRFVDCSMYIDILIKQRMFFVKTLNGLNIKNKKLILEKINMLMGSWKNLKMLFYIAGMRRQRGVVTQLYKIVNELIDLDFDVAYNMIESI